MVRQALDLSQKTADKVAQLEKRLADREQALRAMEARIEQQARELAEIREKLGER